jgi:mono/diheme cytochrome c family protein
MFDAIHNGVAGTAMPAWAVLGDDAIWDLTAFVLAASDAPSR